MAYAPRSLGRLGCPAVPGLVVSNLDLDDLLHIANRVVGNVEIRDVVSSKSAAARPLTFAFGEDAYATIHDRAAALVHSIARNHALLDGNKRVALAALIAFYGMNGHRIRTSNDAAYNLIVAIASGGLDDVPEIAMELARAAVGD